MCVSIGRGAGRLTSPPQEQRNKTTAAVNTKTHLFIGFSFRGLAQAAHHTSPARPGTFYYRSPGISTKAAARSCRPTGQIASTVLNILGYNAVNLQYGMMDWNADHVSEKKKWDGLAIYSVELADYLK
jgi:hypothetical protein